MKNIKSMFFVLTLITLLATAGAVCAADDSNNTIAVDNSVSSATDTSSDTIAAEPVTTTSNDNKIDTKTIEKEEKNLKTATKTVEVNNYNELISTLNSAVNDAENDEYIINLNEGTYVTGRIDLTKGTYNPLITINANNQTLSGDRATRRVTFNDNCNITINNAIITHRITAGNTNLTLNKVSVTNSMSIENGSSIIFKNSTINTTLENYGILIISDDCVLGSTFTIEGTGIVITNNTTLLYQFTDVFNGDNTLTNLIINKTITNNGNLTLSNITLSSKIINNGKLIISDDTIFNSNCLIDGYGMIEINDINTIAPFITNYNGNYVLNNIDINNNKTNLKNLVINNCNIYNNINNLENANLNINNTIIYNSITNQENSNLNITDSILNGNVTNKGIMVLNNSTLNSTISNYGCLTIDEKTSFTENFKITGLGEIIINNITRLLPYMSMINGKYTITDTTLENTYTFSGNITLDNCTITSTKNINYGVLYLKNSKILVDDDDTWMINYGVIITDNSSFTGKFNNHREFYDGNLPENYVYDEKYHIVNNDTISRYFDSTKSNNLSSLVEEGDTLDFQGTISGVTGLTNLVINKPVNIITSTDDGRIENFSSITYNNGASGSNITGLYTYNTQFYVRNAHNIVFDNISNVVNSARIGWGVGQTSIGHNSTNITVKNSYFYTKDNGGSSTFVFNWADNSTLVNSTVEADGNVGNLVYLTTYNVDVPSGTTANCNNQILNNTIRGPEKAAAICWAIVLSGNNNTVDGNTIHYVGTGITGQWGSGITGEGIDDNATSLVNNSNHKIFNNQLYTGIGFTGITGCILVNNTFYNNSRFRIGNESLAINNTANNLEVMGINSIIRNNNIITNNTYTINGTGTNNTIKDNYLKALDKYGDDSVNLNKERNTITNNTPKIELIIDTTTFTPGQNTTIQAGIYFDGEILTDITKGKVTFKIDGKTLKDSSGKVIYAKIVNGIATIENYTVPDTWNEDSTIQAVYSGSTQCEKLTSEKENITINKQAPTLTINPVEPATAGSTITLKATITDNNKQINTGKVVFKINGKTLKDANGKVIYAKVVNNEVIVEYSLPDSYKAKDYTITATLISPDYERIEDSETLTVN